MKNIFLMLLLLSMGFLISCNQAGLQGTNLPSKFNGIESAVPISPTTVKLTWPLQARFKEYLVYRKGFSTPLKTETFAKTNIGSLVPDTLYEFSVSGVESTTGNEYGFENIVSVRTFANFIGIQTNGLNALANGAVEVKWPKNGVGIRYHVYAKRESESSWDLTQPIATVINENMASVASLPSGVKYCFWVIASYEDGTSEPSNMSDSYLNSKAPCALVQAQLANLPTVYINSATLGSFPWFWIENGDPSYRVDIFERVNDNRIATQSENDVYFRAVVPVNPGYKNIYAKVSAPDGRVTVVDVKLNTEGKLNLAKPLVRALEGETAAAPIIPRLVGNGLGVQNLGSDIKVGDFNCDGLQDVAISAPGATPTVSARRAEATGAVTVFYSYQPPDTIDTNGNIIRPKPKLKTDVAPTPSASFPEPQLIYYSDFSSGNKFGVRLSVGNANGDCFSRYQAPTGIVDPDTKINRLGLCDDLYTPYDGGASNYNKIKKIYSCDDLAIQTESGAVHVVFGDPVKGLVSASGGSSYGLNETTCDPTAFKCRPAKYKEDNTNAVKAITFGDFNNDGFDDLAMSVETKISPTINRRQIHILRGSTRGLWPASSASSHAKIDLVPPLALGLSFETTDPTFTNDSSVKEKFGDALGTAYNSRLCVASGSYQFRLSPPPRAKGYDFTKCDDLVIGAPGRANSRGSIVACKGVNATSGDKQQITGWTCKESYPDTSLGSSNPAIPSKAAHIEIKGYGSSILGVPNQNGYPLTRIFGTTKNTPDITGAVFVGAPDSTVSGQVNAGVVFGYYVTPSSTNYSNGGIFGILQNKQTVKAVNSLACGSKNNEVKTIPGVVEHCENQALHTSPPEKDVRFGYSLGTLADLADVNRGMPALAVGAPYRSVVSSDGRRNISNHGVAYVFTPDTSTFGTEDGVRIDSPQLTDDDSTTCSLNCTWYSGGINPFGPSIIYAQDMTSGTLFGSGGLAGADFDGDSSGDFIVGAPNLSSPSYFNGAVMVYSSRGAFASAVTSATQVVQYNFSKELNYNYQRAKVVGDINGDGYADVVTHISVASSVELIVYYGGPKGLITTPEPSRTPATPLDPVRLVVDLDDGFGIEFHAIGSVNGDAYADLLVVGDQGSYIFYGSSAGVVHTNAPSINPVGKNPLKFAMADDNGISFHGEAIYGKGRPYLGPTGSSNAYDPSNRAVTYGDFNGDGYSDFAVGVNKVLQPSETVKVGGGNYSSDNNGRVVVIYGSLSGPQVNRVTGKIMLKDPATGLEADVLMENPCSEGTVKQCKVQLLVSPDTGGSFGWRLEGLSSMGEVAQENTSELVIADPMFNSRTGRIYLYEGSAKGLSAFPKQKLDPSLSPTSETKVDFGNDMAAVGDINGDLMPDLAVSISSQSQVFIFYTGMVNGGFAFYGGPNLTLTNTDLFVGSGDDEPLPVNTLQLQTQKPKPQRINPIELGALVGGDFFGYGISAVGDVNNDGYADLAINAPGKDYDLGEIKTDAGAVVIYYGSSLGLRINGIPTTTPKCFGGASPICEPYMIYLPERQAYENTYISNDSSGDINGDGVPDIIFGSVGRNHPSQKAFSTGVIYVLY